ncbi:MAG: 50S ribosomal protein L32 [Desulfovibrio sp.]|jgi:large subunit ribosomal protein L32|nr:50S ribosomal protein L32 [Desulfovibrio sp.]
MAVQQNKKSRSRKGMRRSHDHAKMPNVIYCGCGEPTLSHGVCPSCGNYKNVLVKPKKVKQSKA